MTPEKRAEALGKKCKKSEMVVHLARAYSEKDAAEDAYRGVVSSLTEARERLNGYESIAAAIRAVAKPRGTVEEVLSQILDAAGEITELARANEEEVESLQAERLALLERLGLTEHEWRIEFAHETGGA